MQQPQSTTQEQPVFQGIPQPLPQSQLKQQQQQQPLLAQQQQQTLLVQQQPGAGPDQGTGKGKSDKVGEVKVYAAPTSIAREPSKQGAQLNAPLQNNFVSGSFDQSLP